VLYLLIGGIYNTLTAHPLVFFFVYAATFFISALGPNVTTFVFPQESLPRAHRSVLFSIASAAGTVASIIGPPAVAFLLDRPRIIFWICGASSVIGFFSTFLLEETMGKPLNEDGDVLSETLLQQPRTDM